MSLPTLLEQIVAQRRAHYGVAADRQAVFSFNGSLSSVASNDTKDWKNRKAKAKAFIEGKNRKARRAVIAEVKMGSPRLGSLVGRVNPARQAALYAASGAVALSVVVEPDFFFGSYELLRIAKSTSGLPVLAKDFVVSERQLDQAATAGADAILLIAALYIGAELRAWAAAARSRGLLPLVETHESEEISRLGEDDSEWELVGINSRDLGTFDVDLERTIGLRPTLPPGALAVAESGIATRADVERLAAAGFDAFLIGESLLLADDPAAKLAELCG